MKDILILGTGCAKCTRLMELTEQAVAELGVECSVKKVEGIAEIISYWLLSPPGLVVAGELKMSGKLPSLDELKEMLSQVCSTE